MADIIEMEIGKIYFIVYSGVQVVCRYKDSDVCNHNFFSHIHYWNGFEKYRPGGYGIKSGIEGIRRATKAEKHTLFRFEVEKGDV